MPKQRMSDQIAELERDIKLEQSGIVSLRAQVEYHQQEALRYKTSLGQAGNEIRWLKRVVECLVSPTDNTRAF